MKHLMEDIAKLHLTYGHPCRSKPLSSEEITNSQELTERLLLRLRMVAEEFIELLDATIAGNQGAQEVTKAIQIVLGVLLGYPSGAKIDMEKAADALADLIVVEVGMALELGIPLDRVWDAVHASNMQKVHPDGTIHHRDDGKVLKPEGWTPPDIKKAIQQQTKASWPTGQK